MFAGISSFVVPQLLEQLVLEQARAARDLTILLCEHDVPFVERLSTRTYVLDSGHLIADGPTDQVLMRPEVRVAYLGVAAT